MNNYKTYIYLTLLTLLSCKGNDGNEPQKLTPQIRYEFSGGAGHYNYAPSIIEDQYGIRYGYVWQPGTQIIEPSETGWDNCHICDPDVREFKTTYKGETYNWIMTYLGVDRWDCNHNQIGLAISKNIESPYIKFDRNPLVAYEDTTKWGVGQSTTIVKDSTTIQLFYHSTTENGPFCMREIKLNDLDNIILGEEKAIPFLSANSYPAMSDKNIYMVSETRVSPIKEIPTWVGDVCRLAYKPRTESLFTEEDGWIEIGHAGPEKTGFPRNHNPGILTDTKGYMLNDDELVMYFTPAMTGENWLWSYDLYSATFNLKNYFK